MRLVSWTLFPMASSTCELRASCYGGVSHSCVNVMTQHRNELSSTLTTNVTSVHLVTAALLPLLRRGSLKKIINM